MKTSISAKPLPRRLLLAIGIAVLFPVFPATAASDVPVYPAAQQKPLPPGLHSATTHCGHAITVEKSYTVDADPHTIAKWYESRMPGSRAIDLTRLENGGADPAPNAMVTFEIFSADGSQTIVVDRMNVSAGFKSAAKSIGLDKTDIGMESISPPFGAGYVALVAQAAAGGASGQKAEAQVRASCKG